MRPLFPGGDRDNCLPRLETESAQAWTLNTLANTYYLSGQPAKALPLFLMQNKLQEKNYDKKNLAIGLGNVAQLQLYIGQFSASTAHLRKRIALFRERKDESREAVGHKELGRILAFQGKIKSAEEEFNRAFEIDNKRSDFQALSSISTYRSLSVLLQARSTAVHRMRVGKENRAGSQSREALEQAHQALKYCEKKAKDRPNPRDFVQAYWLLGEALIQCGEAPIGSLEVPFYDEYFQRQTDAVTVKTAGTPAAAERCLHEALRRCRKVNMVDLEPDILLGLARLDRANRRPPDEKDLEEVLEIALRAGYRRVLADLHLFCGRVLLEKKGPAPLLGFNAAEHLKKAKDYARDVSDVSHLYPSANPDFYKDIPEYDMLKRGMTDEERITNGYWPAYEMAEKLGKD